MMRRIPAVTGLTFLSLALLFFLGCGGGYSSTGYGGTGGGGGMGIATNLIISPTTASVTVSGMQTFTVVTKDSSGNTLSGVAVLWSSSNPAVATINSAGVATGVAVGTTNITASVTYNSGGGYTTGPGTTYTSNMATLTVTTMSDVMGTAATGHALAGAVMTLKDSTGKSQTGMTDAGGHYLLSTAGMQGPFLVRADDGRGHSMFGATSGVGVANVDTVTDLMLRAWYAGHGSTPEQAFADMGAHPAPDAKALQVMDHAFGDLLRDALTSEGVDADKFDLFATPFTANSTGFDAVLDNTHAVTGSRLELQDGLMGRTTDIAAGSGGMSLTTGGTGMQDAQTLIVETP